MILDWIARVWVAVICFIVVLGVIENHKQTLINTWREAVEWFVFVAIMAVSVWAFIRVIS